MDKSGKDKSIPLVSLFDSVRNKHPAIQQGRSIEGDDAREGRNPDEDGGEGEIHGCLFFAMHEFLSHR